MNEMRGGLVTGYRLLAAGDELTFTAPVLYFRT